MKRSSRNTKIVIVIAIAVVVAVVLETQVKLPERGDMQSAFAALGWVRVPAFIVFYALATLLPLPKAVFTIAGGVIFGFLFGTVLVLIGAVAGSSGAFVAARMLGRQRVRDMHAARVEQLDLKVGDHGFATVLVARLVPLIPFTTINYIFGLTSVTFRDYFIGTVIGIIPGTAVYVAVGAYGFEPGSWPFIIAISGLVILTAVGILRSRLQKRRGLSGQEEIADGPL